MEICEPPKRKKKKSYARIKISQYAIDRAYYARTILVHDFSKPMPIKELSRITYVFADQLEFSFNYLFGTSILQYRKKARMEKSMQLVIESDFTITRVAQMMGYCNISNSISAFRKEFGYTPGSVRKKIMPNKKAVFYCSSKLQV